MTINQRSLTVSATGINKVYDGTTAATITGRFLQGVIGADDVSLTGGTATFDNSNYAITFNNGILTISPAAVVTPASGPVVAFMPMSTLLEDKGKEDSFLLVSYPSYRIDMRNEAISDQTLTKSLYEVQNGGALLPKLERVELNY